jgi:hypothetical protein
VTRFYLNVYNDSISLDDEGIERPSLAEATAEAIDGARGLEAESIVAGCPINPDHRVEITNENGDVLHTVRFGDMIDLKR